MRGRQHAKEGWGSRMERLTGSDNINWQTRQGGGGVGCIKSL